MPTRDVLASFWRDWEQLTAQQQRTSSLTLPLVRASARVYASRRFKGIPGGWEMTWAPDGRATFEYGDEVQPGEAHVIWRRIGTHSVFRQP